MSNVVVQCIHSTRQGYMLSVKYNGLPEFRVEKSAAELSDLRAKIVESNPDIAVRDFKGTKWFESKKEEKKKKAVDEFFHQILQLRNGGEALKAFLPQPQTSVLKQSRVSQTFEDSSYSQYEDINAFQTEKGVQPVVQRCSNDVDAYSSISEIPGVEPSTSAMPSLPVKPRTSELEITDAYMEIPLSRTKIRDRVEEVVSSPVEPEAPKVPPKIGIFMPLPAVETNGRSPDISNHDQLSLTPAPRTSACSQKSIPPMPTFAAPPLPSSTDLPDSVKSVMDTNEVHVVALADFSSPSDEVLSFTCGSLASLIVQTDDKWWCVKLGDSFGWVPADYWRKLNPDSGDANLNSKNGSPWFVGKLTRGECEDLLMEHGKQQHFVVRESTNLVGHYAISIKYNDRVHHFPIELTADNKYYIGKHHFKTVKSIISYYKKNPLFFDDNEQGITLGSPLVFVKP